MELQHVINVVFGGGMAAVGWFAKTIYSAVKSLETDLANHKVEVARDYATNIDLRDINDKLAEILRYMRK